MKIFEKIGNALERGVGGLENVGSGIGSMLAQMGGAYAPDDLSLTDRQKRGLLSASIGDRIYGPGANATPQAPQFLNQIRTDQERMNLANAIRNYPGLSESDRDLFSNAPPAQQQQLLEDISGRKFGTSGQANSSLTPQIFAAPTGRLDENGQPIMEYKFGQLTNRGGGVQFQDGTTYDPSRYPEQANWTFVGNSLTTEVGRQQDLAEAAGYGTEIGRTRGTFERLSDPEFADATINFDRLTKIPLEEELLRLEAKSAAGQQVDEARIAKLTETLNDSTNAFSRVRGKEDQQALLKGLFDQAKDGVSAWSTGFAGARLAEFEGTDAYDLKQTVAAIRANVGFDKLQSMREMSKTGGALGNVSNVELDLLTSSLGSLDSAQSEEQFLRQLERVEQQINASWERVTAAFEEDYGVSYYDPNAQETVQQFLEGQIDEVIDQAGGSVAPSNATRIKVDAAGNIQ